MKIAGLMGFTIISVIVMLLIMNLKYVQDTLDTRNIPRGDFFEFGVLIFVVVLVIAFVSAMMTKK